MSIVRVAIHAVWRTKNSFPFLKEDIRKKLCQHIFLEAKDKNIYIDTIDGYTDHLHCLFYLNSTIPLDKTIKLMKGESSHWLTKYFPSMNSFGWGDDYYAVSVSEEDIPIVRAYILNQSEHHKIVSFQEEYNLLMEALKKNGK